MAKLNYLVSLIACYRLHIEHTFFNPDETGSPARIVTRKSFNFYRDSNIDEVKPCYQILQELLHKIQELLLEWPEHPTLQNV